MVKKTKTEKQGQTNEEEINSLPDKEFRVMKVKMIQNLGNKMKAQSNTLEAWIKKIQDKVKEDLEELKNRQSAMNNTITEIKNTLAGTNSGITEAEEQTSEPESRMVKISEAKQNKGKRIKRNEEVSEISGTTLSGPTFEL